MFELPKAYIKYSNLWQEEWNTIRSLADNRNIIFKRADKRVVIWGRNDYLMEKQLIYFPYEYRKDTYFGKFYFLPKINKRLHDVPVRPVFSNCDTPTEKCSQKF